MHSSPIPPAHFEEILAELLSINPMEKPKSLENSRALAKAKQVTLPTFVS